MPYINVRKWEFHSPGGKNLGPFDVVECVREMSVTAEQFEDLLDLNVGGTCRINLRGEPTMIVTRRQ